MAKSDLKTASVLAFERKLDPSDALFAAGSWDERSNGNAWQPIGIREKSVRGTISNRLKTKDQDPAKLDASIQNPNLQTVDAASLPHDADTLRVRFTLRVLGGAGVPSACNSSAYQAKLVETVNGYVAENGFGELAKRYATNLANARFLWRNRLGAEQIEVQVNRYQNGKAAQQWTFDAMAQPLRNFDEQNNKLTELSDVIGAGLTGDDYTLLEVIAYARIGEGQEVFPSQELILDRGTQKGGKSKTLYHVDNVAGMHSQKIGNALRTIDTWYPDAEELGPIAVEPYGSVTSQGRAFRQPKSKQDFYNLLDRWVLIDEVPELPQQHYVMATLVRGGVFGEKAE